MIDQVTFLLLFLGASLLLFVLLGGADYGAGILELFLGRAYQEEQRKVISHAMAPVWEANHVWLILAIVILFVGFPRIYTQIMTQLHVPILAFLMGVVARGCAFTFRYYDAKTGLSRLYSWIFSLSSLWSSFFIGLIAGAMHSPFPESGDFQALYIAPWANPFCAAIGIFTCCLFTFLASVYLVGETSAKEVTQIFETKIKFTFLSVVTTGALILASTHTGKFFFENTYSVATFSAATLLWVPFWIFVKNGRHQLLRVTGASIVSLVLLGWFSIRYPAAYSLWTQSEGGLHIKTISFFEEVSPDTTLRALLQALVVGSVLIFPSLAYLLKVFKWESVEAKRQF